MLTKLKKDLKGRNNLPFQDKKTELKINSKMNVEQMSEIISEKLLNKIKENVC